MNSLSGRARWSAVAFCVAGVLAAIISCGGGGGAPSGPGGGSTGTPVAISTKADLGKAFFFDTTLSTPAGMSCGTCHSPAKAFTDPRPGFPTSQGVVPNLFHFRNAPSISYMAFSPDFAIGVGEAGAALGGQFWDGRALNLKAQAKVPLLNPIEMNNPSTDAVVTAVKNGPLAAPLKKLYGASVFTNSDTAFASIVDAIVTFEKSKKVSPFSSKYDAFLAGTAQLNQAETRGLAAFNGKGGCSGCHTSAPALDGTPPLFTNFCYANLGLPKNKKNPFYTIPSKYNPLGAAFRDVGLGKTTGASADDGSFMTPSLRNVALTAPYFHNGIFTTLEEVVKFYNARDLGGFDPAEVPETMNTLELGNLGLSPQEVSDIVAFLKTLTDGYVPASP